MKLFKIVDNNLAKEDKKKFLKNVKNLYYVYILKDNRNTPFYVGKGSGARIYNHKSNNFEIYGIYENKKDAYKVEAFFINKYGMKKNNGKL